MRRIRLAGTLMLLTMLIVAGCSSPVGNDADATATFTPVARLSPTATTALPDTTTATPNVAPPTATPSPSSPTLTPTEGNSSTSTLPRSTSPTPTEEPLPVGGAELRIEGQTVTRIIQSDDTGRSLYAIAGDNFWRSADGGHSWVEAGEGDIGSVVISLNEPEILYTGDRGGCGRGFSFYEFRRSTDAGRSWEVLEEHVDIEPLLAYESPDTSLLYGTNCGLSVSNDGGTTWARVPDLNGEDIFGVATERSEPMVEIIVVAATEGGTGRLFLLDTTSPAQPLFIKALTQYWGDAAVDWTEGRILLANAHRVGVSDDGGETWSWTRNGLENATYTADPLFEPIPEDELDPFRRFTEARIDPTNRDHLWIGGSKGAFLSIDGGQSWDRVGDVVGITGLAISALTDRVMISSESGTRLWSLNGD